MRDKLTQIEREEIAEIIAQNHNLNGEKWDASDYEWAAHCVQMAGYRKASDVAREIFEEIDNMLLKCISASHKQLDEAVRDNSHDGMIATTSASEVLKAMRLYIAELKKKYESEGEG